MLTSRMLVEAYGVTVADVRCRGESPGWSPVEPVDGVGVVLVRSGLFRRRVDGADSVLDAASGYLQWPGGEQRVAHPAGGDRCTSLTLTGSSAESLVGDARMPGGDQRLSVRPSLDLAHRELVARARRGTDVDELAERALAVVAAALSDRRSSTPVGPVANRRRIVDDVRQAIHDDPRRSLGELAALVGLSPYHLSRTFRRTCGLTISRYRTRLRVRRALERFADGERDIGRLAADLGFADQAHLTRVMRGETGHTPGRARELLGSSG